MYIARTCNADVLDRASQHAIDTIELTVHVPNLDVPDDCADNPLAKGCR